MPDVKVAAEFKQNAAKSILAIILFIICYLVISAIVVALAFMFVYLGLKIVESGRFGALSLFGGLSAIAVACFLLFFIIKFIFKRSKKDLSGLKLVSAEEQPELFRLIHEIVAATNTSMPKRVYLSADVNASVFYDSSFWSMFLPVKKNLMIGLALVNSVTANEFKAILAHEFGHFSQRSMKVGSYVYQVNQIIYNLLYDNDSYFQAFNRFAKLHAFFAIGIKIGFSVIQGVQWVLRKIYGIVNLQYMALSREMEFHADAIAAHVTGSKPLGDSLLRLNLANQSFDELLNFYDQKKNDNIKTLNFFPQHGCIMEEKAKLFNLPIVNHLPFVTVESIKKLNKSRLNIKDQWASHPDDFDRIEKLDELHITHQPDDRRAWEFFSESVELQEYFTARIFSQFEYPEGARNFSLEEFREEYLKNLKAYENHPIYNSYFDYRTIIKEDMESAVQSESSETLLPSELFPDKIAEDLVFYNSLRNDYLNLENISKGAFNIKNFDFNGIKYDVTKATGVLRDVEQQLNEMENMFRGHDKKVMNALYLHAVKQEYSDEWKKKFRDFFVLEEKINSDLTEYQEFLSAATFMHETHPFEIIHRKMAKLKEMEAPIKQKMIDVLHSDAYRKFILTDERMLLEKFTGCEWTYFIEPDYYDEYVTLMYQSMNTYAQILVRKISMERKQLLDWQASFLTGPLNHAVSEEWRTTIPASS